MYRGGLRVDRERFPEYPQIVAVAGAQHDAMLAEGDRPGVAVFGLVMMVRIGMTFPSVFRSEAKQESWQFQLSTRIRLHFKAFESFDENHRGNCSKLGHIRLPR